MPNYHTLQVERGYLLNFGELGDSGTDGKVTQAELNDAMTYAEREIRGKLGRRYDTSNWYVSTPPLVAQIADLLGSSYAWLAKYSADGLQGVDPTSFKDRAHDLMDRVLDGTMDLHDSGGDLIEPTWARIAGSVT